MRYYIIRQVEGHTNAPLFGNLHSVMDVRMIDRHRYRKLPERIPVKISENPYAIFPGTIIYPILLFSEETWQAVKVYLPFLPDRQIILIDAANNSTKIYHLPILEKIYCLSDKSITNRDRSVLKNAVLKKEAIEDEVLFQIGEMRSRCTVVRLDLLESILFRDYTGIALQKVNVE